MKRTVSIAVVLTAVSACSTFGSSAESAPSDGGGASTDAAPSAPPPAEDCLDGRDDNGDGRQDCEEPTCAPYVRCVPGLGPLTGWSGYSALAFDGDCPKDIPQRADGWVADTTAAVCSPCRCDGSIDCTGVASALGSIDPSCNPSQPFDAVVGACAPAPSAAGTPGYWLVDLSAAPTSCTAVATGAPTLSPKYRAVHICSGARLGGGCPSGSVCAGTTDTPAGPGICVWRTLAGGPPIACPSPFPVAHLVVEGAANPETAFVDHRGCVACSCATAPTGASCNATMTIYSDGNCGTAKGSVGRMCAAVTCGNKACGSAKVTVSPVAGTCAANGGGPTGQVELAASGMQYCCDR